MFSFLLFTDLCAGCVPARYWAAFNWMLLSFWNPTTGRVRVFSSSFQAQHCLRSRALGAPVLQWLPAQLLSPPEARNWSHATAATLNPLLLFQQHLQVLSPVWAGHLLLLQVEIVLRLPFILWAETAAVQNPSIKLAVDESHRLGDSSQYSCRLLPSNNHFVQQYFIESSHLRWVI